MKYVLYLSILAAGICLSVSCKKSSGGVKAMLEATWKSEQAGVDKNGNGIIDSNELHSTDSLNESILFISTGDGEEIGADYGNYPIPFYWALSPDNQYLQIEDTTNHAVIYHIDLITNTQLILRDTAGGVASWNIYKKS